jgi:hypothetical protein
MAREDRDGSATGMGYMAFVSFVGRVFREYKNPGNRRSRFSLTAVFHNVINAVMMVTSVPIVHNSGSHDEVQNLVLSLTMRTLGDKAGATANYRVTNHPGVAFASMDMWAFVVSYLQSEGIVPT